MSTLFQREFTDIMSDNEAIFADLLSPFPRRMRRVRTARMSLYNDTNITAVQVQNVPADAFCHLAGRITKRS